MSDEENIDVESDEETTEDLQPTQFLSQADKRAHHNALERKRRDHIKDSFCHLRDSVPSLHGEKASRAQILNKATDYINYMRRKNHSHQTDIEDLKQQNVVLDQQVHNMEKQRNSGLFNTDAASALISTTDTLLNTSPLPSDPLLDIKEPDSGTLDPFVNIDSVDGDANTEEYTTPSKRIKTDV
ncbi:max isoform X1 [Paramuricea clavata]|uniref:Protein max n=1 Tax=Paramuricea clavata TaxID=317549 RepID=A0A6S7KCS6_PARCT|nr:max isoform X1 [Paramuricea clavata]